MLYVHTGGLAQGGTGAGFVLMTPAPVSTAVGYFFEIELLL